MFSTNAAVFIPWHPGASTFLGFTKIIQKYFLIFMDTYVNMCKNLLFLCIEKAYGI